MKKLVAIIIILIIIFIGMLIYKNINTKSNYISMQEIDKIETYITKIYMWKEITNEAIPEFENINEADDLWVWEVIKKNIEEYEMSYEEITQKGKELFGTNFSKELPIEGSKYLVYDEESKLYHAIGMGLDEQEDSFFLNKIERTKSGYEVEIVEYLEDYSGVLRKEQNSEEYDIIIMNTSGKEIGRRKNTMQENTIEIIKENIEEFTKKKIILESEDGKIYVQSVRNMKRYL